MGLGAVISNLLSLGTKLIPVVSASAQASSSPSVEGNQIETELKKLMRLLERIKAMLYDADGREIRDESVKLWLRELREVAYDAEDVLDEYHYEVLRAQVEARDSASPNSSETKLIQVPDGMLDQIQQIMSKFAEIVKDQIALQLLEEEGSNRCNSDLQIAPTSHFVVQSDIIGRQREKEKLIDILSSESHDGKIISVVAIVGTGGIGKTTLAKLVYNDQRIQQKFDKFGWVCVSDDFDVHRLTREVVESIMGISCGFANLSALQEKINKEIRRKRIFLVLDDVWNEKRNHWELFRTPFMSASLVKILVTTRIKPVARIMQTMPSFNLTYMSEKQSWQLFQHYAFDEVNQNEDSNLVKIGRKIMKKCGMLPLAIKSIACLLRHEPKEESWREILESELWESDVANEIFTPLQISYTRLPTYLKPCFLYCSMFPKDYIYNAEDLMKLWISQGYVQTELKNEKKVAWEYAKQLWQRSFFEGEYWDKKFRFTLHDMVHDLARFNSWHGCYSVEGDMIPKFPQELHHLYVREWVKLVEPPPPRKFATLRSFMVEDNQGKTFLSAFDFSEAQKLRALLLVSSYIDLQSHFSLANLKHLRYLFLGKGIFERLPECICSLYNLQNLALDNCPNLIELPESIGNLVSLEELTIKGCCHLTVLPMSICQLKVLRQLILFACPELEELPSDMGKLVTLEKLIIVRCLSGVLPVSFCQLKALRELKIEESNLEKLPLDIGNLVSLEVLTIFDCDIRMLPASLCQLKALRNLNLCLCFKLEELPFDMGNLKNLRFLTIRHTDVSSLPPSLNKIIRMTSLRVKLHCMTIGWLENFVDLEGSLVLEGLRNVGNLEDVCWGILVRMPNLQRLILDWEGGPGLFDLDANVQLSIYSDVELDTSSEIYDHSLIFKLQPHPNLEELQIEHYMGHTFPEWIGNPTLCASLKSIKLVGCEFITFLPFGSLDRLKYLRIVGCSNLEFIQAESLPVVLEVIAIDWCHSLISVSGIQRLKSLVKIEIANCSELHWLDLRTKTCVITVSSCPKLRTWCSKHGINYKE